MTESLIGASIVRPDATGKVTGATRYPADLVQRGMLHLAVRFAGRPHARIRALDSAPALAFPGVEAVLTHIDVPFNAFGLVDSDQPVLCGDKVRFEGDKIALVAASSAAIARAAAARIAIDFEDLPAVTDPIAAMQPGAPLVHEAAGTNVLAHHRIHRGDPDRAFASADIVLEETFTTSWQEHAFLQPEAGIAFVDADDRVVIETAGQWLHEDRRQIAAMLQIPADQVVVRYAAIGGAFGGREDLSLQHLLALAAWKLRRPVAIEWTREESMIAHHKRHPMRVRTRWAANRPGTITAVETEVIADGGAYASTSTEVLKVATLFATGSYRVPNVKVDGYAVYTNNVPSGAFRGFGAPQSQFAAEIMVTRLAQALGIDPVEFRRRNLYTEGDLEPTGHPLPRGVSALPVLDACLAAMAEWAPPSPTTGSASHLKRGIGIACGIKNAGYSFGYDEQSSATVEIDGRFETERRATVRIGAADVGQGTHLALRQIAAETLGLPLERVTMITDDSSEAPNAGSASASRLTLMAGRAVAEAAAKALTEWRDSEREHVAAEYRYRPPATTPLDPVTGDGIPNYCYGYSAQAVEVEVNTLTGQVQVTRIVSAHDVGKAINRQQVEGQIEGCLAQALGYTLLEHFQMRDGHILTPHFSSYLLPTALDMPLEITPVILELADPNGPFGARGVAEMPLVPFAPAVAAAIHDAVGTWLTELPMTPERVLERMGGG